MTVRDGWRAAFALSVVVQLVVLYVPRAPSTGGVPGLDKAVHALVFGVVAFTALRAGSGVRWVVAALVAHAIVSEVLQATVLAHRDGDWRDALADCLGVGLGYVVHNSLGARPGVGAWRRP